MRKLKNIVATLLICSLISPIAAYASIDDCASIDIYCNEKNYQLEENLDVLNDLHSAELIKEDILTSMKENPDLIPVEVVQKEFYLSETYADDGTIVDSHLMTEGEVNELKNNIVPYAGTTDSTTRGKLYFTGTLYQNSSTGGYNLSFRAEWEKGTWIILVDSPDNPSAGNDFIAVDWEGDGKAFKIASSSISGTYQVDGKAVGINQSYKSSYYGIGWDFAERKNSSDGKYRYFVDTITGNVNLDKVNSGTQGKSAGLNLIYYHTYSDLDYSLTLVPNANGFLSFVCTPNSNVIPLALRFRMNY